MTSLAVPKLEWFARCMTSRDNVSLIGCLSNKGHISEILTASHSPFEASPVSPLTVCGPLDRRKSGALDRIFRYRSLRHLEKQVGHLMAGNSRRSLPCDCRLSPNSDHIGIALLGFRPRLCVRRSPRRRPVPGLRPEACRARCRCHKQEGEVDRNGRGLRIR
jgi:hypothetical protein